MNVEQHRLIEKAILRLQEVRSILDYVMNRMDALPDNERERLNEVYDMVCKANSKL